MSEASALASPVAPVTGVIGAGVVGTRVVRDLARSGLRVIVFDQRRSVSADLARDLPGVVAAVAPDDVAAADVVVVATPAPHAPVVTALLDRGTAVVTISDDLHDTLDLIDLGPRAAAAGVALVAGAAMAPGLSGLLARWLAERLAETAEIHVASHGTAGPGCARQHHRALSGKALGWHDDEWIERQAGAGRELCWFPEPIGARDCYRAELADPSLLRLAFPGVGRISARLSATRRDRLTAPLPMLSPPHREGGIGALRVEVRGCTADGVRETFVVGVAERAGTVAASVAASVAARVAAGEFGAGLHVLGAGAALSGDLLRDIVARGICLREFVGVAQ